MQLLVMYRRMASMNEETKAPPTGCSYVVEAVSMERVDRRLLQCPSMIDNNTSPKGRAQSYIYTVQSQGLSGPATDSLSHRVAG